MASGKDRKMEKSAATKLQDNLIEETEISLRKAKHVAIDCPTGTGKSRIFSKIADNAAQRNERVLIMSHRQNLANQAADNIRKWTEGQRAVDVSMKGELKQTTKIVSATVQTLNEKIDNIHIYEKLVIDEAHHAKKGNDDYNRVIDKMLKDNPKLQIIALSATFPDEMEGMRSEIAKAEKHVITFEQAIEARLIDLPKTMTPSEPLKNNQTIADIVGTMRAKDKGSDIAGIGATIRKNIPEKWDETLAWHYEKNFSDKKTLAYFDTIKDAEKFTKELAERGIKIEVVHSGKKEAENDRVLDEFKNGSLMGIASVDMISEGYDVDARGVFLAKLTTSQKEYKQIIGRESRSFGKEKGEKSLLLDMGASTHMHGEIGAQAKINNIRKKIDAKSISLEDLAPESEKARGIWKPTKLVGTFAAAIDGGVVYAVKAKDGYYAMTSRSDKKGSKLTLLEIEGQKKGRPTKKAFVEWVGDAIRRNEKAIARAMTAKGGLEAAIMSDWEKNSQSIERNIQLMSSIQIPKQMNKGMTL